MKTRVVVALVLLGFLLGTAPARADVLELTLKDAERAAVQTSDLLKSYVSDRDAAKSAADAQFQNLLPRLSFQATYQYYGNIPQIQLGAFPPIDFGTNSTYFVGPTLNYTLWDTFSGRKAYQSASLLEKAREEDRDNAELQLLAQLRAAYVQVQLGIEELQLINDSMDLARAQDRDVLTRYHAGAAARLDLVTADRSVLSYQMQFEARQAELSASLHDLMTLLGEKQQRDLSRPGPAGIPRVTLVLKLEPLQKILEEMGQNQPSAPGDNQPQIRSLELQSDSASLSAESQTAHLFPSLQISGGVSYNRPDIPDPPSYMQETVSATLSLPLYLGDPSPSLAAQARSQADSARFRESQLRENLERDYTKGLEQLASLREQRQLAARDIAQSEEEARLYYTSYKAGKINLIDVQNANNQALQAKVSAARIDAQTLNQLIALKSISGQETHPTEGRHD